MPITKSAVKASRQSKVRHQRRLPVKTTMKTMIRKVTVAVKGGDMNEAKKLMPAAYKAIDMAAKKNLIHWKNAARKKSTIAKMIAGKAK